MELTREKREWEQDKTLERDTEGRELAKSKLKGRKQSKTKSQNKEQGSRNRLGLVHFWIQAQVYQTLTLNMQPNC